MQWRRMPLCPPPKLAAHAVFVGTSKKMLALRRPCGALSFDSGPMRVEGWTLVFTSRRTMANLVAAVLQANGLHVEVLGGRVMVPDQQAESARRIIRTANAKRSSQ